MNMRVSYRLLCLVLLMAACKQVYEPPAITAPNRYLVVEGVINATAGARTTILLSWTRNLQDSIVYDPAIGASIQIESSGGNIITLSEQAAGRYVSQPLTLNVGLNYRLKIRINASEYLSEFVPVKVSPAIDSLSWKQAAANPRDVTLYVSTHDPSNNSKYYRWDFVETWQYRSVYETDVLVNYATGLMYYTDSNTQVYNCWNTDPSTDIVIGSSVRLAQDVIDRAPVTVIPQNSPKLDVRYSILVKQYVLTPEAHKFYEILQKNTEQMGTLFDPQPSQLKGNITRVGNPNEPVIGFVTASTVTEKRMFIDHREVEDFTGGLPSGDCTVRTWAQDPSNFLRWTYPDTAWGLYYFTSPLGMVIARNTCLDCRRKGGSNQKPSFW